jgi:hypothetical protein
MISDLSNELSDLAGEVAEEIADLADRIADVWDDYFGKPTYDLPWEQGKGIPYIQIRPGNPAKELTRDKTWEDVMPPSQPPTGKVYQLAFVTQYGDLKRLPGDMDYQGAAVALGYTGKLNELSSMKYMGDYDKGKDTKERDEVKKWSYSGSPVWGIYTHGQRDAKALIILFGQFGPPETHGSGMYRHYNDKTHAFHVWFGGKMQY